jgi:DNA-binding MarR family transcriptional regulator
MSHIPLSEFADKVNELMPAIAREFMRQQPPAFHKMRLTLPQFVILDYLSREGESKMSDLARAMNVSTAAMTGLIDRLVRERYVLRHSDPKDRRIVNIALTEKGQKIIKYMVQQKRQMIINVFGRISEAERNQYIKILTHIKEHISA